jgi:flagellar hook-associated protein 1 FlgK
MTPQWSPNGTMGRGVDAISITRARDIFFDAGYRREAGNLGKASTNGDLLSQLESALGEPSSNGLGASLDGLFTAFSDLANDPANPTSRNLARQAAVRLVDQFHQTDTRIAALINDGTDRLKDQVSQANSLTRQIADLNVKILATGPGGSPTLSDQRDLAIDQLSSLMSVTVVPRPDGTVAVQSGGALIVDGAQSRDLTVRATAGGPGVGFTSDVGTIDPGSGSMQALITLTNTTLPGFRGQLDQLAQNLVTQFNTIHRSGFTPTGNTTVDFFDPAGVTGGTIQLSGSILASVDNIATGGTAAPGDGTNAQRLGDLVRTPLAGLGNQSLRDFFVTVAGSIGADVRDAQQQTTVQQTLVDNFDAQRQEVSGVSVDEEMVNLISQQQAYGAAARLVTIANQMVQDLLDMI